MPNKVLSVINKFLSKSDILDMVGSGLNEICQQYNFDKVRGFIRVSSTNEFVLIHELNKDLEPIVHLLETNIDLNNSYYRKRNTSSFSNIAMNNLKNDVFLHYSKEEFTEYIESFEDIGFSLIPNLNLSEVCFASISNKNSGIMGYISFERYDRHEKLTEENLKEVSNLSAIIVEKIANYELGKHLREEEHTKSYDNLTGLPLLHKFKEETNKLLKVNPSYAGIYLDIDKFKYINDIWSVATGNEVLVKLSKILTSVISPKDEMCCRVSDDKFVILVKYINDKVLKDFIDNLEKLLTLMQNRSFSDIKITIIGGVYVAREPLSINLIIDRANIARRSVKGSYQNTFQFYNDTLENISEIEKQLEKRMGPALDNGEFIPFLQPKFDLETNTICGAEALARWRAPDRMISPIEFIPAFEKNGFITRLDFAMYEKIFEFINDCLSKGYTLFPISLNVSRGHMNNSNFITEFYALMQDYNIPVEIIELEITESVFVEDKESLQHFINAIRALGIKVSIDDFGTAYSSLNLLKSLVVDVVKMDKSFIDDIAEEDNTEVFEKSKIIVKNIVNMINDLNFKIIFEGIETNKQVEFLKQIGCTYGQGFVFSRPLPLEDFEEKYLI